MEDINIIEKEKTNQKLSIWRYLLTIFLVVGFMIMAQVLLFGLAILVEGNLDILAYQPINLLWVSMLPFAAALAILLIAVRFIHHISLKSFFTSHNRFQWKTLLRSAVVWFGLAILSDIILMILEPNNYELTFELSQFIPFLIFSLILVPIQITAEESFFRGYLQPAFARISNLWWVGVIIQAILFGLLHGANTEVSTYGLLTTMPFYIGIGILLGVITYRFGGLEASLGLHLANNLYASLVVTFAGSSIASPAIFTIREYNPVLSLILFFVTALIYYVIMRNLKKPSGSSSRFEREIS